MAHYQLCLLGSPLLQGPEGPIPLARTKAKALLCYLGAQPGRRFSRQHLAQLLWENHSEADGRRNLSTTLTRLHQELPVWPIQARSGELGWNPEGQARLDVTAFQELTGFADRRSLAAAAALWRGPFLEGLYVPDSESFEQWLHQERQSWERQILATLGLLTEGEAAAANWEQVLRHARMALAIDPLQERFHRYVMTACARTGDRAAALSHYEQCQVLLQDALGVKPDQATRELRAAIAAGSLAPVTARRGAELRQPPRLPLVGRDAELVELEGAIAFSRRGGDRMIVVQGEAGAGKSRLVEEVLLRLDQPGGRRGVLFGHCHETTAGLAYEPLLAALDQLLPAIDLSRLQLDDVWLAEVGRLLPAQPLDPAWDRRRLFEGTARLLAALPDLSMIVLEGLQWADEGTLFLLSYLARHPLLNSVAIVVTARPAELSGSAKQALVELRQEGRLRELPLGPLPAGAIDDLVAAFCSSRRGAEFARQLCGETEGTPLYVVEMLRALHEGGALGPDQEILPSPLPVSAVLQEAIRARIERLPATARELVSAASIFPGAAGFAALVALSALPEDTALAALDLLIREGILREVGDGGCPAVTFCKDPDRRVVQADLSRARRAVLQGRLAGTREAG